MRAGRVAEIARCLHDVVTNVAYGEPPSAQEWELEYFEEKPFKPSRVDEETVAEEENVGDLDAIACPCDRCEIVGKGLVETKDIIVTDEVDDKREEDGEI